MVVTSQEIIERLRKSTEADPEIDRPRVEAAISKHLENLGQPLRPVRWLEDAEAGFVHVVAAARAAARDAAVDAAVDAARDAAWAAARDAARDAAVAHYCGIWLPFLDAYEAGLWLSWVRREEVVLVPRPVIRILDNRLHSDKGPAVFWPQHRKAYWFWRGVQVPREWIEKRETLCPKVALTEKNTERRRCLYEIVGYERMLSAVGAKTVQRDDFGELIEAQLDDDNGQVARFVRVRCPSTGRYYFNRVAPEIRTAKEAVASRWGLKAEEWSLARES